MPHSRKRRSVPDFIRRGLRQAIGIGALVAIGYEVVEPFEESTKTAAQWLTCFKWAAISLIVLTAPVLGKVAQVSFERTIGTLAGGFLGLTTVLLGREMMQKTDQAFTAIISALVGFGGVWAGHRLGLEYAGKLVSMTFILVVIGADERADAFLVAVTRCSGIILGVLLSVVLAVLVFPKSASHQATDNLAEALSSLCQFSHIAWSYPLATDGAETQRSPTSATSGDVYLPLEDEMTTGNARRPANSQLEREVECEKVLMEVYNNLSKVDEFLPLAKRERYVMTFRGRWCFLPAIPYLRFSDWTIPARPMQELATAIRKVSRVLWALHVVLQEGFEEEVVSVLKRRYPSEMLSELQSCSHAALKDMHYAFPDDTILPNVNLQKFLQVVKDLIRMSDEQRRIAMSALGSGASLSQPPAGLAAVTPWGQLVESKAESSLHIQASAGDMLPSASNGRMAEGSTLLPSTATKEDIQFGDPGAPILASNKLDMFPQTTQGHISKIRWFSFQFLMQQLAEELDSMHRAMSIVLKMLPNALNSRHI